MSRFAPLRCLALWGAAQLLAGSLPAQPVTAPGPSGLTNVASAAFAPAKCPVDVFRELLAKTEAERAQWLAGRSPVSQKLIKNKIREYLALSPEQRELRLQATELRWYLMPLMSASPTNRAAQLAAVPAGVRPLVELRLQLWDKLPPDAQTNLLTPTLDYIASIPARTNDRLAEIRERLSPVRTQVLQRGIQQWQQMTEQQRQETAKHFYQFFDLTAQERSRTLQTISEPERKQIQKTLQAYEDLSPEQRERCIESFEKFASLSLEERELFLKNAERWKLMSPTERNTWKQVVENVSRPRPPALDNLHLRRRVIATNGG